MADIVMKANKCVSAPYDGGHHMSDVLLGLCVAG